MKTGGKGKKYKNESWSASTTAGRQREGKNNNDKTTEIYTTTTRKWMYKSNSVRPISCDQRKTGSF